MEILKVTQEFTKKEAFRIIISASCLSIKIMCILFAVSAVVTAITLIIKLYVWQVVFYIASVVMLGTVIYVLLLLLYAVAAVAFYNANDPLRFGTQTVSADGERLTVEYKNGVKDVYPLKELAHYADTKDFVVYRPDRHRYVPIIRTKESAEGLVSLAEAIRIQKFYEYTKSLSSE